jgi:peptidoglycan-associated lipoprotein
MKRFYLIIVLFLVIVIGLYTGCDKKQVIQSDSAATSATESGSMSQQAASVSDPRNDNGELKAIYFDYNKYALRAADKEILKNNAQYLLKNKKIKIVIEGNCDERGTDAYNLALGDKRAKEAMKYLVSLGVDKKQIKTISYGKKRPIDPGHNEEAWAKNRRNNFVVSLK